jgi:putative CocE/NonD family hydrolase
MCSGDDEYTDRFYSRGGALQAAHRLSWLAENLTPPSHVRPLFSSYITHLPLIEADVLATGVVLLPWRTALAHPSYDSYWKAFSIRERLNKVNVPVLSWGGWFDEYAESDLEAFSRLVAEGRKVETWIGPWAHDPGYRFATRDFGEQAYVPIRRKQLEWFDRWLKPVELSEEAHVAENAKLHVFVMGPNVWREEHEWPLRRARATPLYLASEGHANSARGDGRLEWHPVREAPPDGFVYDPKHPVPTTGGAVCCDLAVMHPGPLEQGAVEEREDVLVYTSRPLREEIEVTGTVQTVLYVATSANDTDFTAKLVDVQPNGEALLVTDGIQRLRYRLSLAEPVFVKRGTAYQISIDTGVTSYVFEPGHSIRLEISSSNFPRFDRNLNTTRPVAEEWNPVIARQTVYHQRTYPSVLVLPVVPRGRVHHGIHVSQ